MTSFSGEEIIIIKGQGIYTKKSGKWFKTPLPANAADSSIANVNPTSYVDKLQQRLNTKVTPQIGADQLNGAPMVTDTYSGQGGSIELWYGVTDSWLYKVELDDPNGTKTVASLEYNIPLTITPPI